MPAESRPPRLLGCTGCGSAIVELAFALAGKPLEVEEVDYSPGSPTRDRLLEVNPLVQVPALVLPGGQVLTESLAILHWLDDAAPGAGLIPGRGEADRAVFYRWIVFLVAAIYPTFTYGDDPGKWVSGTAGAKELRESTDRHRERLWLQVEAAARTPWFLGERLSAIDLYLIAMTRWRPGAKWFEANAPVTASIARRASHLALLSPVVARHFG